MKKTPAAPALAPAGEYRRTLKENGRTLLAARARWPRLTGEGPGVRRVNRYYEALADRWIKRWEGPLLERARSAPEGSPPWEAALDFTVTLFREDLLSLWWEAREAAGGSRPRRLRQGDVWQLPAGVPVTLRSLLPPRRWWRGPILEEIRRQVGQRVNSGECIYYEDWPQLVSRRFSPSRFYLTEEGPAVFYPMESIAPTLEGFPTFSLAALVPPKEL